MGSKMKSFIKNYYLLILAVFFGLTAVIFQFGFGMDLTASVFIYVLAGIFCVNLIVEMIKEFLNHHIGVDVLALSSIILTLFVNDEINGFVINGYWSSLIIMIMVSSGTALENYANKKAISSLEGLINNVPKTVHIFTESNYYVDVPINDVKVGERFMVKPGEIVPLDGKIISDEGLFDTSSITGESGIKRFVKDDIAYSGFVNGEQPCVFEAVKEAQDSQYQSIVKIVKESNEKEARFVRVADRYAVPFTFVSYALGFVAWLVAWLMNRNLTPMEGLARMCEVLVIASPCPMLLAVPVAFVAGKSKAASKGIIIKESDAIERLSKIDTFCFDKTGTLTIGNFIPLEVYCEEWIDKNSFLEYVCSIESHSSHVLANSFLKCYSDVVVRDVSKPKEEPGKGIEGYINGKLIKVGKSSYVCAGVQEKEGLAFYVSIDGKYAGCIIMGDRMRENAKETIDSLKEKGIKHLVLLSGDKRENVMKIADEVGIDEVYANCLPEDKIRYLGDVMEKYGGVAMVGDGVNDAPSMKKATVGIALAKGNATITSECADIIVMKDDIYSVSDAYFIAKNTVKIAKEAVLIGIGVCIVLMVVAIFGFIPSFIGAILQELIDVISILYALKVLKLNDKKKA